MRETIALEVGGPGPEFVLRRRCIPRRLGVSALAVACVGWFRAIVNVGCTGWCGIGIGLVVRDQLVVLRTVSVRVGGRRRLGFAVSVLDDGDRLAGHGDWSESEAEERTAVERRETRKEYEREQGREIKMRGGLSGMEQVPALMYK